MWVPSPPLIVMLPYPVAGHPTRLTVGPLFATSIVVVVVDTALIIIGCDGDGCFFFLKVIPGGEETREQAAGADGQAGAGVAG